MDPKTIDDAKAKHPGLPLRLLALGDAEVIVRVPSSAIYRKSRALARDEKTVLDANEKLVRDCLIHPDQQTFTAMVEAQPGLVDTFAGKLVELAGAARECEVVPL